MVWIPQTEASHKGLTVPPSPVRAFSASVCKPSLSDLQRVAVLVIAGIAGDHVVGSGHRLQEPDDPGGTVLQSIGIVGVGGLLQVVVLHLGDSTVRVVAGDGLFTLRIGDGGDLEAVLRCVLVGGCPGGVSSRNESIVRDSFNEHPQRDITLLNLFAM